jgi:predicted ATPase/class 3 adenylate cyclase
VSELPTGTVTFLMTDVQGSTPLWEARPDVMGAVIERHDAIIAGAVRQHGGELIRSKGEGDSTFSVFADPAEAVGAAADIQLDMQHGPWPGDVDLRVRVAVYTGDAELRNGDYYGTTPNRGGRLRAVVHGGQIICSESTEAAVAGRTPHGLSLVDLGLHRLRDVARAERVFQVCHPDLAGDFPPLLSLGVRHNLPAQRTNFVGRDDDVIAVQKHLEVERLVTLTGVGGCGKTRLAIEVATEQLERFPDGVFFADLSPLSDAHTVAGAVAAAVGFSQLALGTGSGRPTGELLDFLSTRDVLLVIDNCEHVLDAAAHLVDEILERCPRVSALATSREALELQGEQVYPVAPLSVPEDDFPEASDSVRLFCDRALLVRPDFVMSPGGSDVAEICRRLDGIPLAIELAAAQIAHLSPRQIVERLGDRLQLLSGGRLRAQRQQTLHGALDWSHDLLSEDERAAFRSLAVFPGSFSHDAAEAVCAARPAFTLLGSLVGKSLVVAEDEGDERRYKLLETVRFYAEEKLVQAEEGAIVRDRHRDHFLAWSESIPPEMTYLDPQGSVRKELHNLRVALTWSEQQGRLDLVGRLASTMNSIWLGDIRDGRRWLSLGIEAVDELAPEHRVRVLTVAAFVAVLAMQAGDGELARRAVEASEDRPGTWSSLAHALLSLNSGIRFFTSKNPVFADETERLGAKAVELAPDVFSRGLAWFWLGQARVLLDDLDGAIDALEKGSVVGIPGGDMSYVSVAMLAGVLHITGRRDEARAAAEHAVERPRSSPSGGLWAWVLYCSLPYALELGEQGRHLEAISFMRELLEEGATPRTPGVMTSVVVVLGALAVQREDDEAAHVLLDYAGTALLREGTRTPIDIALYSHYLRKLGRAADAEAERRSRDRAQRMSLDDAIAFGLRMVETPSG